MSNVLRRWNWMNSWSWTKQLHQERLLHSLSETYFFLFEMSSSSSSFAPDDSYVFKSKLCCAVDLKLEKRVVIRKAPKPSSALSSVLLLFLLSLPDRASRLSSPQQARRVSSLSEQRGPVRSLLLCTSPLLFSSLIRRSTFPEALSAPSSCGMDL